MSWTDERVETLKKLHAEGLSASQIAKRLGGVTRNAVIGKRVRLGLVEGSQTPASRRGQVVHGAPSAPAAIGLKAPTVPRAPHQGTGQNFKPRKPPEAAAPPGPPPAPLPRSIARAFQPLPGSEPVDLMDLTHQHCRWPVDCADGVTRSCGRERQDDRYCSTHVAWSAGAQPKAKTGNELVRSLRWHAAQ